MQFGETDTFVSVCLISSPCLYPVLLSRYGE